MQSKAATVAQYLAELPEDRRAALQAVRKVFRENLDPLMQEGMQYGMIGYFVPHSVFPPGYHCDPKQPLPFAGLASQKNAMSLYLMCLYGHQETLRWFTDEWKKTGKKLDMGKACIRFKKVDDLALEVIAETLRRVSANMYIEHYTANLSAQARARTGAKSVASKKSTRAQSTSATKPRAKKTAKKTSKRSTRR